MQRLQDTEGFILIEFGNEARAFHALKLEGEEARAAIQKMVKPYLDRLRNNGIDQRTRMLMMLEAFNAAKE